MRGRLQLPLKSHHTRIRLLLWSYEDAAFGSNDGVRGSKPQSRALSRNPQVWNHGAYPELERVMERLRSLANWSYREIERFYVGKPWHQQPESDEICQLIAASVGDEAWLRGKVILKPWQVPREITEAAGYRSFDAKEWHRPCGNPECGECK